MDTDQSGSGEREAASDAGKRSGMSRRKLFGIGAIMLLGLDMVGKAKHAGGIPAVVRLPRAAGSPVSDSDSDSNAQTLTGPPVDVPLGEQQRVAAAPQYYLDGAGPMTIALTLDDGPHPVYTPQVLEILDQYGIQATFNMVGRQIGDNLPLVREVAAAGHTITNHTWDHPDMRKYTASQVMSEMDRCNDALAEAGQTPTIFRAPYGYWTPAVFEACSVRGLTPLGWSVDPQDWDTAHVTTMNIVNTVLRKTHRHDIILEHDGGGDRSNTVAALRIFIPELLGRGFVFAAV